MRIVDVRETTVPIRSHGGLRPDRDWLQSDCALSDGLVADLRTLEAMRELGWSPSRCIPHGGHQQSLSIAAGLRLGGNESYPDPPGIGFEGKADLIQEMRALSD